jgi:hypothetical protein
MNERCLVIEKKALSFSRERERERKDKVLRE